ncbi:MAG: BCCT family transporter [Gammaproteobacteria bacterium]|nr:BCCT family transporter [Gammaproteobacteria bacterium]
MFGLTLAVILIACVPIFGLGARAETTITGAYDALTQRFGWLYLWYGFGALVFLLWLAASRYGRVRLGGAGSTPEFRTPSWLAMMFCAGVGAGLLYWVVIEWGYYIDKPPYGFAPRSPEAIEWAASYGLFHWGPTGWAIQCLPGLAIAYAYYQRRVPYLRLSTGCSGLLPGGVTGIRGRAIDFLYMLSIIGGAGTSLGLSTPMISAVFADFAGLERSFAQDVAVVAACIAIFGTSAYLGIERGFKRMADAAMWVALLFLLFVLLAGPTLFIVKMATNSIGLVMQNFLRMNTWTDPVRNSGFVENWTVFYWAWWIAYGPFVGLFVTRISRGRRLRDIILGMLSFGTLGAGIFFLVLGNYSMHLDLAGLVDVTGLMKQAGEAEAIAAVIGSLPFSQLALLVFLLVAIVLLATTYDSASYTLASVSTRRLEAGHNPARWNRLFWACALGIVPVTLMFVEGGIKVVLSATIVVSLPLLAVGVLLAVSLMRMLRQDVGAAGAAPG